MPEWGAILAESLVVAVDVGLTLLFYKLYKLQCSAANSLKDAEPVPLSELKELMKTHTDGTLEYAVVEGEVYPVGKSLKSQYTDDEGPIKHFTRVIHKSERQRGYWSDHNTTLSDNYERVPFALFDKKGGSSILVTDPSSADCLTEAMHTTYDHFEPHTRSITESVFDRIVGEITKGYKTTERILKNGTAMLGLGKVVLTNGTLELRSPDDSSSSPYILTSMTKQELIEYIKSKATVFKVLAGIFGFAGVLILWVTAGSRIKQYIQEYKARAEVNEMRRTLANMRASTGDAATTPTEGEDENNNSCVICWANEREVALRPCGHVCSCLTCYEAMPAPKQCPVCRTRVAEIIPVFIA